jgi:hypothetical protein
VNLVQFTEPKGTCQLDIFGWGAFGNSLNWKFFCRRSIGTYSTSVVKTVNSRFHNREFRVIQGEIIRNSRFFLVVLSWNFFGTCHLSIRAATRFQVGLFWNSFWEFFGSVKVLLRGSHSIPTWTWLERAKWKQNRSKMDTTPHCSRVVPHPSTERAQTALTSVFGWEPVDYSWYGRIRKWRETVNLIYATRQDSRLRDKDRSKSTIRLSWDYTMGGPQRRSRTGARTFFSVTIAFWQFCQLLEKGVHWKPINVTKNRFWVLPSVSIPYRLIIGEL